MVGSFIEMWAAAAVCNSRARGCFSSNNAATPSGSCNERLDLLHFDISNISLTAVQDSCQAEFGFALGIGVASLFLSIVLLILNRCCPGVCGGVLEMIIIVPLFLGWFAAMSATTMGSAEPWGLVNVHGANGYFTTWLCTCVSWMMVLEYSPVLVGVLSKNAFDPSKAPPILLSLLLSSLCCCRRCVGLILLTNDGFVRYP